MAKARPIRLTFEIKAGKQSVTGLEKVVDPIKNEFAKLNTTLSKNLGGISTTLKNLSKRGGPFDTLRKAIKDVTKEVATLKAAMGGMSGPGIPSVIRVQPAGGYLKVTGVAPINTLLKKELPEMRRHLAALASKGFTMKPPPGSAPKPPPGPPNPLDPANYQYYRDTGASTTRIDNKGNIVTSVGMRRNKTTSGNVVYKNGVPVAMTQQTAPIEAWRNQSATNLKQLRAMGFGEVPGTKRFTGVDEAGIRQYSQMFKNAAGETAKVMLREVENRKRGFVRSFRINTPREMDPLYMENLARGFEQSDAGIRAKIAAGGFSAIGPGKTTQVMKDGTEVVETTLRNAIGEVLKVAFRRIKVNTGNTTAPIMRELATSMRLNTPKELDPIFMQQLAEAQAAATARIAAGGYAQVASKVVGAPGSERTVREYRNLAGQTLSYDQSKGSYTEGNNPGGFMSLLSRSMPGVSRAAVAAIAKLSPVIGNVGMVTGKVIPILKTFKYTLAGFAVGGPLGAAVGLLGDMSGKIGVAAVKFAGFIYVLRNLGAAIRGTLIDPITHLAKEIVTATETYRQFEIALLGVAGSMDRARAINDKLLESTQRLPLSMAELQDVGTQVARIPVIASQLALGGAEDAQRAIEDYSKLITKFSLFDPAQGVQGVGVAFREALAGEFRSLRFRLELSPEQMASMIGKNLDDLKADPQLFLKAAEKYAEIFVPDEALDKLSGLVSKRIQKIKGLVQNALKQVGESGFYDDLSRTVGGFQDSLFAFLNPENGGFQKYAKRMSEAMTRIIRAAAVAIRELINGILGRPVGTVGDVFEDSSNIIATGLETLASAVESMPGAMNSIGSGLRSVTQSIVELVGLTADILAQLRSLTGNGGGDYQLGELNRYFSDAGFGGESVVRNPDGSFSANPNQADMIVNGKYEGEAYRRRLKLINERLLDFNRYGQKNQGPVGWGMDNFGSIASLLNPGVSGAMGLYETFSSPSAGVNLSGMSSRSMMRNFPIQPEVGPQSSAVAEIERVIQSAKKLDSAFGSVPAVLMMITTSMKDIGQIEDLPIMEFASKLNSMNTPLKIGGKELPGSPTMMNIAPWLAQHGPDALSAINSAIAENDKVWYEKQGDLSKGSPLIRDAVNMSMWRKQNELKQWRDTLARDLGNLFEILVPMQTDMASRGGLELMQSLKSQSPAMRNFWEQKVMSGTDPYSNDLRSSQVGGSVGEGRGAFRTGFDAMSSSQRLFALNQRLETVQQSAASGLSIGPNGVTVSLLSDRQQQSALIQGIESQMGYAAKAIVDAQAAVANSTTEQARRTNMIMLQQLQITEATMKQLVLQAKSDLIRSNFERIQSRANESVDLLGRGVQMQYGGDRRWTATRTGPMDQYQLAGVQRDTLRSTLPSLAAQRDRAYQLHMQYPDSEKLADEYRSLAISVTEATLRVEELDYQSNVLRKTYSEFGMSVRDALQSSLGDGIANMIMQTGSLRDALVGLANDITRAFSQMASQQIIQGLFGNFLAPNAAGQGTNTNIGTSGGLFGSIVNGIAGWWTGGATAMASGGIVTRPTAAIIGEGRHNEAVVPMPDGGSIPLVNRGGSTFARLPNNRYIPARMYEHGGIIPGGNTTGGGGRAGGGDGGERTFIMVHSEEELWQRGFDANKDKLVDFTANNVARGGKIAKASRSRRT